MITTDRAALNFTLAIISIICIMLAVFMEDVAVLWRLLFVVLYLLQLLEALTSQTFKLLWNSDNFDDLDNFRKWFAEIKKCRPIV